jgi:uncharacterized protein (TIGR00730 family)
MTTKTTDTAYGESRLISVFGSSAPLPGSPAYELAREVGASLARAGFAVATGGYAGTMAAVSQGAAEQGGRVVGVGCERIEAFRGAGFNRWVGEAISYETLTDRLLHLVRNNDGMVVLPGGVGTLSEFALAWSLLQVGELERRPLVLVGPIWRAAMAPLVTSPYVGQKTAAILIYASTPVEVVEQLKLILD